MGDARAFAVAAELRSVAQDGMAQVGPMGVMLPDNPWYTVSMNTSLRAALQSMSEHPLWHLLYPRERAILSRQQCGVTLTAIARDLGVSSHRVGQIRHRALFVLSTPSRLQRRRSAAYAANPQAFAVDP